ncbi:MAG: SpoIIE family protein phosphatase [candidate division Zixibacteria bacterium]|nr:SpoIIE family protein phosphatase [candidate division Zixibacteria bacterium]
MYKLVGTDGDRLYVWMLNPGEYHIGRGSGSDFCIPHRTVSRNHAQIRVAGDDSIRLTDLGSHNGTFINGKRLNGAVDLHANDVVLFGQTEFKIAVAEQHDPSTPVMPKTILASQDPLKSVYLSINEALKPLPKKATDLPGLLPAVFEMAKTQDFTEPQETMLHHALEKIATVVPSERLAILFVSDDGTDIYTAASHIPDGRDPGELVLSRTIVNEIITNKTSILISDPKDDPRFAEQKSIIMSALKSAIAVPLFDENKVLGILYIDTTNPLHRYNDDYLRVLATFGNIIASRLLNYALLQERESKQVMEAELSRAASIQKNLLVSKLPDVEGFAIYALLEQSRSVGGDLYDFKVLPDGRLLFVLADVSGKGLGAALLTSNILASFRILYDLQDFDLCDAVRKVSLQLFYNSDPGDFATLFIGCLDPGTGRFTYINAGHNPPLIIRENGELEHLEATGTMIGAFDFATWDQAAAQLEAGDVFFVFTDGVTEADRQTDEDQYGEERMEELVIAARHDCPAEIAGSLISDINEFMGETSRSDDITMLIIKRNRS